MSHERQYGVPAHLIQGYSRRSTEHSPVSPVTASTSAASLHQAQYGHPYQAAQVLPPRQVSPIQERYRSHRTDMPPPLPRHSHTRSPESRSYAAPPPDMFGGASALRDIDNLFGGGRMSASPSPEPEEPRPYAPAYQPATPTRRPNQHRHTESASSATPLMRHSQTSPMRESPSPTRRSKAPLISAGGLDGQSAYAHERSASTQWRGDGYNDDAFDPNEIADDGDDGFIEDRPRQRRSIRRLSGAAAGGAAAGGGFRVNNVRHGNEQGYDSLNNHSRGRGDPEKSEWLDKQSSGSKQLRWIVGSVLALVILGAIIGGAVGGVLAKKHSGGSGSSGSTSSSSAHNGLYDIDSSEVKALLNNKALHKVFPGMDYTPLNTQYPDCLSNPPDQNNITLDIAMLAQLTPAVRLYGTDCNQTEMVLTAINQLEYNSTLQVWLGVWLGTNQTTNERQMNQMYDILKTYPSQHFAGIIVGNEVLFRKDLTETQLAGNLTDVRKQLASMSIDLPVATSDLGDDWTSVLAQDTDIVMANVHPFFAGVKPDVAPGWTYNFWQTHDAALATASGNGKWPKSIISEVGWPSEGGNDCGTQDGSCPSPTAGAVASIDNMNTFMHGFVCQSLNNGTTFFWFEAFDEPWKHQFDTATDKWESKWGLMDENRNVKDGLVIPDCGGQTVDKAY